MDRQIDRWIDRDLPLIVLAHPSIAHSRLAVGDLAQLAVDAREAQPHAAEQLDGHLHGCLYDRVVGRPNAEEGSCRGQWTEEEEERVSREE